MNLIHTFEHENRKALVYLMDTNAYFIRFYENDVIGHYQVVNSKYLAEQIADDYVLMPE